MSDTPDANSSGTPDGHDDHDIVVYWRPGCPFCGSLFRQLDHAGVPHRRVDIWADPEAAAIVRSIARGNETVPTVVVGGGASGVGVSGGVGAGGVGLVNPSVAQILAAAGRA